MAFLIKIGYIPKDKLEYMDYFGFESTSHNLPSGIQKIKSNDKRTIVYLDPKYIKEVSRLPVNHTNDQETDYPISNCHKQIDQFTYDILLCIYNPTQNSITLGDQKIESVVSASIWHLDQNTANTLIKYHKVGPGKKIIFVGDQPSAP